MSNFSAQFQVGNVLVDPSADQLALAEQKIEIQSMAMKVLCFFASNGGKLVTRDDLRESVWQNTTTSNHTINNHIYSLRQSFAKLDPDTKYFHTVTGRNGNGYRLLAPIIPTVQPQPAVPEKLDKNKSPNAADNQKLPKLKRLKFIAIFLILGLAGIILRHYFYLSPSHIQTTQLTFEDGREQSPAISSDGKILLYSHRKIQTKSWELYSNIVGQKLAATKVFDSNNNNDNFVSISPSNKYIAFRRLKHDEEGIYIADFDVITLTAKNPRRVISLQRFNLSPEVSWYNDNLFYYTVRSASWAPNRIFSYRIDTGETTAISSPAIKSNGDIALSLSPDRNWLGIIRTEGYLDNRLVLYHLPTKTFYRTEAPLSEYAIKISFSDDSKAVYFVDNKGYLSSYHIESEQIDRISDTRFLGYWPLKIPGKNQFILQQEWGLSSLTSEIISINNPRKNGDAAVNVIANNGLAIRAIEGLGDSGLLFASLKPNYHVELWRYQNGTTYQLKEFNQREHYRYPLSFNWQQGTDKALLSVDRSCRLVNINTGKDTPLCPADEKVYAGTFSDYDKTVLLASFESGRPEVLKMGASGYPLEVVEELIKANMAKQTVDGQLYYRVEPGADIFRYDPQTKQTELLIDRAYIANGYSTNDFVVVQSGIYFMDKVAGKNNAVYFYSFAEKSIEHVVDSPNYYPNIVLSPDEKLIYLIRATDSDTQLNLLE
ncbi:MAG: winged helix-turn-helix domain-containing protein [Kangiellaceae bacterium]|nr:winged helix-turn-helix domain-containing protein [Kangiellaceae bacterium]MCW8999809.1 winged helix-turn-helix domain-containing protein [Kangiellaceae bacterium]MCW9017304.1 winged helix-turn-helix domain-containing protein [Kangiellaceae bacterium]